MENKMSILTDSESFIIAVAHGGSLEGGIDVDKFEFTEDIQAYQYLEGKITLNTERLDQLKSEHLAQEELQEVQEILDETDAVALQRWEESELGLEHELPEPEFQEILKKRQRARLRLKQLNEVITCSKQF